VPDCGGKILVEHDWKGSGPFERQIVTGFECASIDCCATWDPEGNPT